MNIKKFLLINFRNVYTQSPPKNHDLFASEFRRNHIKITSFQKNILALSSSIISLSDPQRADMIALLGEVTGSNSLKYILKKMQRDPEGLDILKEMPRINSATVDLEKLKSYPKGTLGKVYSDFLQDNKVTPDSRMSVQFIDDMELAYVMQRYREVHDLFHSVLLMPTNMLGEVTVKWFEAIQTQLPMCIGGALFGAIRLAPKQRVKYVNHYLPWAIDNGKHSKLLMNCYFEKRWEQPIEEIWKEFNIKPFKLKNK